MRYGVVIPVGALLGVLAGLGAVGAMDPARAEAGEAVLVQRFPLSTRAPGADHAGALDRLHAVLEPAELLRTRNGEELRVHVLLENLMDARVAAQYALELVDDRGSLHALGARSQVFVVPAGQRSSAVVAGVGAGLADGYYILRLTAASSDGARAGNAITPLYLHVEAGSITPIDAEEFYRDSNANLEVRQ